MKREDEMKKRLRTKLYGFAAAISEGCLMHTESYDLWLDRFYELIPHWISVEDGLPKEDGQYLGCVKGKAQDIVSYLSGRWLLCNRFDITKVITHWMPLPAPPTISERYKNIAKSDFVKEHYRNKSLGDTEGIKDELDCIGSDGSDPFDEVEKQIESQHKKEEKQ